MGVASAGGALACAPRQTPQNQRIPAFGSTGPSARLRWLALSLSGVNGGVDQRKGLRAARVAAQGQRRCQHHIDTGTVAAQGMPRWVDLPALRQTGVALSLISGVFALAGAFPSLLT